MVIGRNNEHFPYLGFMVCFEVFDRMSISMRTFEFLRRPATSLARSLSDIGEKASVPRNVTRVKGTNTMPLGT